MGSLIPACERQVCLANVSVSTLTETSARQTCLSHAGIREPNFSHVQICLKSKNCSCISFCRYKRGTVSRKLRGLLVKPSSLRLWRGVKCGRKTHGRLVVSFIVQKSFVKCIRVSELHLTACSLMEALFTSSPPCTSVSNSVSPAPPTVHISPSLSLAPKTCGTL